jgi:hypothetical protein
MSDLNALFDGVDGLKADLMEYGTVALAAVGTKVAWDYALRFVDAKIGSSLPAAAKKYGYPLAALVAASVGQKYVRRHLGGKVADGFIAGLSIVGVSGLIKAFVPSAPVAGLAGPDDEVLFGLGQDPYARYLDTGVNGLGATSVEESVAGFGATSVEESVAGLGYSVEDQPYAAAFTG